MDGMPLEKLTPQEISRAVEKIRQRYDQYIYKFFKPKTLKDAFEDRYIAALKSGTDVSMFLMAEISAVEELLRREEERLVSDQPAEPAKESIAEKVDRIVIEQQERIRKYPEVPFHPVASEELRRLLGALGVLEDKHWESLGRVLQNTTYYRSSLTMTQLEGKLRDLASRASGGAPPALSRYLYHANRFPRNYLAIDREEKEYILESAFFLHELNDILVRVSENYPQMAPAAREGLHGVRDYVQGIIRDFRLKELKRRK
jgi:hypothetical protein